MVLAVNVFGFGETLYALVIKTTMAAVPFFGAHACTWVLAERIHADVVHVRALGVWTFVRQRSLRLNFHGEFRYPEHNYVRNRGHREGVMSRMWTGKSGSLNA